MDNVDRSMDEEQFSAIVNLDLRDDIDDEHAMFLRDPENLDRWHSELVKIKGELQTQFARTKSELEEARQRGYETGDRNGFFERKAELEERRARMGVVLRSTEKRLREVKLLRRERSDRNFERYTPTSLTRIRMRPGR